MPVISLKNKNKIKEQILYLLFSKFPKPLFTAEIAQELARDEEFIKKLLIELHKDSLLVKISKNSEGINYLRRIRWRISNKVHEAYSKNQ
jgi:predicted transcriptional regulator with HTH domain